MLPEYTIRESARARHVRFCLTMSEGLIVVIPKGFDRRRVPDLLRQKNAWLSKSLAAMEARRASMPPADERPTGLDLPACGQQWRMDWVGTSDTRLRITEIAPFHLQISGPIGDAGIWTRSLRTWLAERGREILVPWTRALAHELGLPVQQVTVRCQKTRWGSYSSRGTVSLNAQLLFLPRALVRYVLVHELCHAVHPNHSPEFWQLLLRWEPDTERLRSELRRAGSLIPAWLPSAR